ncbi:hypothetical protein [Geofilum rubicundum]|uniref:Uncharacterized protein n=1 Tax=Geofilum rubicundum JCM 15548 TaxID=1236989 RepID=A0A0E9LR77_9BACT|nr:hypothetical protein [Geofilum rubicundum]GAO27754.1 hypothetical protein JCM15548_14604 [Geofilum rubicundum JCM 15548]
MNFSNIEYRMKHFFKILVFALALTGCQKEYEKVVEPDKSQAISAEDNIAELIKKVALKDGSFDNIIDRCSAISIEYPYSILINDEFYQINSLDDIEILYIDYFHYRDDIEIQYPITITYSDYSESVLDNSDDLEEIQEQYNTNLIDDDIECIDFNYPVEITLYNTAYQKADYIVAENDFMMYNTFRDLSDQIIEVEYPIELTLYDGNQVTITDNVELENQINEYKDSCEENDEVDFEDEDYPVSDLLTSGIWKVSHYSDTTDETHQLSLFTIEFKSDFSVQVTDNSVTIDGTWEFDLYDNLKILEIEVDNYETPLVWLNDGWEILSANNEEILMQAESDTDGFIKKLNLQKTK